MGSYLGDHPRQPGADAALVASPESTLLAAHGRLASPAGSDGASQGHVGARPCLRASGWLLAGVSAVLGFSLLCFLPGLCVTHFAVT